MQKVLPDGATIAPIILASDKTLLSQFQGDKSVWPVYMSIATVLLGYLPTGKLDCFTPDACSLAGHQLFHHYMRLLLHPLITARNDGVDMVCADSWIWRVYLILVAYVADFPEQCLVSCCEENHCPKFLVGANKQGYVLDSVMRDPEPMKDILQRCKNDTTHITPLLISLLQRFKAVPDYPGLWHFKNSISNVKQWMGSEHKEMQ
ncbi:uncharacterized protein F5891DRAFT_953656 [Suillus fuscotomentosus]|uniref:Uncharacterized protein n=1 Tax=Suillus fuscotomentosus TaxID=1912939 RepID=A0AAD4E4G6_9AGAM|nr:uncharacterized protein F5891DRAFT_953656 [Suillus fuscotomentosus]KAG1899559.1 hypothetical protein F5891DRAFT_953656 [Suillus fuscotomentosus]